MHFDQTSVVGKVKASKNRDDDVFRLRVERLGNEIVGTHLRDWFDQVRRSGLFIVVDLRDVELCLGLYCFGLLFFVRRFDLRHCELRLSDLQRVAKGLPLLSGSS